MMNSKEKPCKRTRQELFCVQIDVRIGSTSQSLRLLTCNLSTSITGGNTRVEASVYSPKVRPLEFRIGVSIVNPTVGMSTTTSNNPSRALAILAMIFFFTKLPIVFTVGTDDGKRASKISEVWNLEAAKSTVGDRSRANCISGRYFFTSNTSNVDEDIGIPLISKSSNLLKSSEGTLRRESNSFVDKSAPNFGANRLSKENDTAMGFENDGAKS